MSSVAIAVHYWEGDIPRFLKGILLEEKYILSLCEDQRWICVLSFSIEKSPGNGFGCHVLLEANK